MLSNRKKFAASGSLLLATAGVVATVQITSPAVSSASQPLDQSAARQKATVTATIVPGAIGPGSGTQSSRAAKWAVTGKYASGKAGKKVVLQQQSGNSWKTVDKTEIDKNGAVLFAVPAGKPASPVVYRIDGPGSPSAPVTTASWGTDVDFVDDFGGSKLDTTEWQQRQQDYFPDSRRTCAKGDPQAVKVGGGAAQLSVIVDKKRIALCKPKKPGKSKIYGKFKYRLNANIGTQATHSITFGVVSARIKFNPLQGQHASLWMQPSVPGPGTDPAVQGTEIDIIEWFGKDVPNGGLTSFIYAPSYLGKKIPLGGSSTGGWIRNPEQYLTSEKDDWYKRYHVFSVEWTPSSYIFRIDGQETGRINKGISHTAEYPILSLLSSDYELSKLPDRDEKANLPQTMSVDWIKTWQNPAYLPTTPTPAP